VFVEPNMKRSPAHAKPKTLFESHIYIEGYFGVRSHRERDVEERARRIGG